MRARDRRWAGVILLAVLSSFPGTSALLPRAAAGCPCPALAGIYPTVVAPLACGGGIDTAALERQLRFDLDGGVHGLLLLGTIGEGEYLTLDERAELITTAVRVAGPAVPIVVGIHTCDLDAARTQLVQAKQLGATAVLIKYAGNPCAAPGEVLGFFAALCDLHALPILYYHYPAQTRLKLSPEDVAAILCLPGVVGIKESTLNLREVRAHMRLTCGQGKVFLSGSALNLTQFLELGGHGAMCPEALLLPALTVRAYDAYRQGCRAEARAIQAGLFEMTPILLARPKPPAAVRLMLTSAEDHRLPVPMGKDQPQARLKDALNYLGVPTPTAVKCPLPPLTEREDRRVRKTVCRLRQLTAPCAP